ncbi:unnamed protein product [Dracunculus medinensis]|uniref:Sm domain-containing protein n=1 Tax=Dracunculus medinensis TaxID=318479 RepID=A0A0N4UDL7_DRAME|nr:unnamed protein product [Dracunculus medinensis]
MAMAAEFSPSLLSTLVKIRIGVNNRVLLSVGKKIQIVSISDNFLQNLSDPTLREAGTTRNGMVMLYCKEKKSEYRI